MTIENAGKSLILITYWSILLAKDIKTA